HEARSTAASRPAPSRARVRPAPRLPSRLASHDPHLQRHLDVEQLELLASQMREKALRLLLAEREPNLHRHIAGQFEEVLFVQPAVAAESRNRAKGRTAMDTHLLGLFEQPFIGEDAVVAAILLDIELEVDALHW